MSTRPTPLISEEELTEVLQSSRDANEFPLESVLRAEVSSWSDPVEDVVAEMSTAANGEKIFKTLVGHPDDADPATLEARVVEFVRFYGAEVNSHPRSVLESVAVKLIRASPVSEYNATIWSDSDAAVARVAELYDFVEERREEDASTAASGAATTGREEPHDPTPQELDGVSVPSASSASEYDERSQDLRKDLFGI